MSVEWLPHNLGDQDRGGIIESFKERNEQFAIKPQLPQSCTKDANSTKSRMPMLSTSHPSWNLIALICLCKQVAACCTIDIDLWLPQMR